MMTHVQRVLVESQLHILPFLQTQIKTERPRIHNINKIIRVECTDESKQEIPGMGEKCLNYYC